MRHMIPMLILVNFITINHFTHTAQSDADGVEGINSTWTETKQLYDTQQFQAAIAQLQKSPQESSAYYYDLGTLSFKAGQFGRAVAYLEKANRLHPHEPDIQFNLSLAKKKLSQLIGDDQLDPSSSWLEQLADRVSLDEVRGTLGLLGLVVVLLWLRAYVSTRNLYQALFNTAGLLGILGFGITVGIYGIQRWADAYPPGICLESQVIRSGPGEHFLELVKVESGAKLRLLSSSAAAEDAENWRQVRYSPDGIGWIKASTILTL